MIHNIYRLQKVGLESVHTWIFFFITNGENNFISRCQSYMVYLQQLCPPECPSNYPVCEKNVICYSSRFYLYQCLNIIFLQTMTRQFYLPFRNGFYLYSTNTTENFRELFFQDPCWTSPIFFWPEIKKKNSENNKRKSDSAAFFRHGRSEGKKIFKLWPYMYCCPLLQINRKLVCQITRM